MKALRLGVRALVGVYLHSKVANIIQLYFLLAISYHESSCIEFQIFFISVNINFLTLAGNCLSSSLNLLHQRWVLLLDDSGDVLQTFLHKHVQLLLSVYPEGNACFDCFNVALLEVD